MRLTIYLIKEFVKDISQIIKEEKLLGDTPYEKLNQKSQLGFECEVFIQKNLKTIPRWLSFISDKFNVEGLDLMNQSNSLILLMRVKERLFAITAGYGYTALNKNLIETDFGLKVVLNEINANKIRSIDTRNLDTNTKQKRVLLNENSPLFEFDFNVDDDLLKQVIGVPINERFGKSLCGSEALVLNSKESLIEIQTLCGDLLTSYSKEDYKTSFSFIDDLRIVKDINLINSLYEVMVKRIGEKNMKDIYFSFPSIEDFFEVENYRIVFRNAETTVNEVTEKTIQDFITDNRLEPNDFGNITIQGFDEDNKPKSKEYGLFDFVIFEEKVKNKLFIHNLRNWYEVDEDYVVEITKHIKGIPDKSNSDLVPKYYCENENPVCEAEYNSRASIEKNYLLLDQVLYFDKKRGKVEVCDLLTPNHQFICVKREVTSSTLSHLFNQGLISANLLLEDPKYRTFVRDKTSDSFFDPSGIDIIDRSKIEFIFAIATKKKGPISDCLPLFSKISLYKVKNQIERLGIKVSLFKIELDK